MLATLHSYVALTADARVLYLHAHGEDGQLREDGGVVNASIEQVDDVIAPRGDIHLQLAAILVGEEEANDLSKKGKPVSLFCT